MSLLSAEIACQLWFPSSVRVMRGNHWVFVVLSIAKLLWQVLKTPLVPGPGGGGGRGGGGGGGGWGGESGGWMEQRVVSMWQESACARAEGCAAEGGRCEDKCGNKTTTEAEDYKLSEPGASDCGTLSRGCSQTHSTLPHPTHPKHPWLSVWMVKPGNPPPPPPPPPNPPTAAMLH